MRELLTIVFLFCVLFTSGQSRRVSYYGLTSDTLLDSHILTFLTDSTVELSSMPRHMSAQYKKILPYTIRNSGLEVLGDTSERTPEKYSKFSKGFLLVRKGKALVDTVSKVVYVPVDDFDTYCLLYIVDGRRYLQKMGQTDGYGIVKKQYKQNASLKDALEKIEPSVGAYTVSVYKGFEAFQKYGYKYVFGVIELTRKL